MNVARFVKALGAEAHAYALVGILDEERFRTVAAADGVLVDTFAVPGKTRDNLTLTSEAIGPMAGHASGPRLDGVSTETVDRLVSTLLCDIDPGDIVVLSGAIPDGLSVGTWTRIANSAVAAGGRVVVDGQGAALVEAIRSGTVSMTKPNEQEVGAIPGVAADDPIISRAIVGLRWMVSQGVDEPVVSLGARGIVHRCDDAIMLTSSRVPDPRVAVAAGDAFVAGYCAEASGYLTTGVKPIDVAVAAAAAHVAGDTGLRAVHERVASFERVVLDSL